jgi:hypothetical protein
MNAIWAATDDCMTLLPHNIEEFIASLAANGYVVVPRAASEDTDDGQPDESQEWRDFDPDC